MQNKIQLTWPGCYIIYRKLLSKLIFRFFEVFSWTTGPIAIFHFDTNYSLHDSLFFFLRIKKHWKTTATYVIRQLHTQDGEKSTGCITHWEVKLLHWYTLTKNTAMRKDRKRWIMYKKNARNIYKKIWLSAKSDEP